MAHTNHKLPKSLNTRIHLPSFAYAFLGVSELVVVGCVGEFDSILHGLGPVHEVQVQIVQSQVLQSEFAGCNNALSVMVTIPGRDYQLAVISTSFSLKPYHLTQKTNFFNFVTYWWVISGYLWVLIG